SLWGARRPVCLTVRVRVSEFEPLPDSARGAVGDEGPDARRDGPDQVRGLIKGVRRECRPRFQGGPEEAKAQCSPKPRAAGCRGVAKPRSRAGARAFRTTPWAGVADWPEVRAAPLARP